MAVEAVSAALGDQGFAILTEIDLRATLKQKLDVDVAPHTTTFVEAFDPDAMIGLADNLADNEALHTVAADAEQRLTAALAALTDPEGAN